MFHGTSSEAAEAAFHHGFTADRYSPYNRTLSKDKAEAGYFAVMGRRAKLGGAVLTVRIPRDQADEYLDGPDSQGLASLKKPLPASMVTKVEHITGPMAGQVTRGGRGLGWLDAGDELLRAVAWDPAEHPRGTHGKFARKPGLPAAGVTEAMHQYLASYDELPRLAESIPDDDVQAEMGRAISALRVGNGRKGSDLLAHAAVLAQAKATDADKKPADRVKLKAAAEKLQAAANAAAAEWGGQKYLSAEMRAYAEQAKSAAVRSRIETASSYYDTGDWAPAVGHLGQAALDAFDSGDTDLARRLQETIAHVQENHDDPRWLAPRLVSDQIGMEQKLVPLPSGTTEKPLPGNVQAAYELRYAQEAWDGGDPAKTVAHLRAAATQIEDPAPSASARLLLLADRIDSKLGENAKLTESVRGFVAKGASAVPEVLGGGKQTWNGTLEVPEELPARGLGVTLADIDWSGHMRMIAPVAKGVRDDMAGTGQIESMDSFTVPLHELIHGTIGGRWQEQQEAHAKSGRTMDDDAILGKMANLDRQSASGGVIAHHPVEVNGTGWVNETQEAATLKATTATMESLARRGYLEWTGTTSSVLDPKTGKLTRQGRNYKRTAKAVATDPPGPEPGPDEGMAEYADPQVQPIEEGFTELGTVQHAAAWYRKIGIGDRETPVLAVGSKPDPVAKAKLARELEGHAGEKPGEAHGWYEAARAVRRDDETRAHQELAKLLAARGGSDSGILKLQAKIDAAFLPHVVDNPAYAKARAALLDDVAGAQQAVAGRLRSPGQAAVDRTVAQATLQDAQAALSRVHGNLDAHAPPEDTLAELARLKHLGDKELYDTAVRIQGELNRLAGVPESKHATMAEYAERVAGDRERIVGGNAWGHYPEETKQAYLWCEAVAEAEGLAGDKLQARIVELADEINRESAAHKMQVMAAQVAKLPGMDDQRSAGVAAAIRLNWEHGALIALQEAQRRADTKRRAS